MLTDLQRLLLLALTSDAPLDVLREGAAHLRAEERTALEFADADGLRVAGLLVRKCRFDRLCRGDAALGAWFERDPAQFTELYRAYEREIPAHPGFPEQEAAAFRLWLSRR